VLKILLFAIEAVGEKEIKKENIITAWVGKTAGVGCSAAT